MRLSYETIKEITVGAADVALEADGVHFYRMNGQEMTLYREMRPDIFFAKTFASSGIRLGFVTDSRTLKLTVDIILVARKYYSLDVTVNGKYIGSLDSVDTSLRHPICQTEFNGGVRSAEFDLGEGEKSVSIYLPWSVNTVLHTLELDDGSTVKAAPRAKKMLAYGDSITQGYDAARPINKYTTRLALALGADEYNKGIGGEMFFPDLAGIKQGFTPDLITVAYGINDWAEDVSVEDFMSKCKQFYENLRRNYPETPIYAITPIWYQGGEAEHKMGSVRHVGALIRECVRNLGITVIDGYGLVPGDKALYADFKVHPSDEGFSYYAQGLIRAMGE